MRPAFPSTRAGYLSTSGPGQWVKKCYLMTYYTIIKARSI